MYSISSVMNNKYSISDLYQREKYDINDIVSVFNKIDSKLDSQKIKVTRIKKDNSKNILKGKSKTSINFFKNNSNFETFKSNSNILLKAQGNNEDNSSLFLNNNNKKMNFTSYEAKSNNLSNFNFNETSINNQMSKTNYNSHRNKKSNILNYKTNYSLRNVKNNFFSDINKNKEFSNTAYPTLFSKYKENKVIINNNKKENKNKIKLSKLNRSNSDFSGIFNMESKQYPLSCKNNCFNITKFGAIIYNHSMFRNKNIVNFVPNNCNLPLMYKNIKI